MHDTKLCFYSIYIGVPILHLIALPIQKWYWHYLLDNADILHYPMIEKMNKIFRLFVAQYLGLEAGSLLLGRFGDGEALALLLHGQSSVTSLVNKMIKIKGTYFTNADLKIVRN